MRRDDVLSESFLHSFAADKKSFLKIKHRKIPGVHNGRAEENVAKSVTSTVLYGIFSSENSCPYTVTTPPLF